MASTLGLMIGTTLLVSIFVTHGEILDHNTVSTQPSVVVVVTIIVNVVIVESMGTAALAQALRGPQNRVGGEAYACDAATHGEIPSRNTARRLSVIVIV